MTRGVRRLLSLLLGLGILLNTLESVVLGEKPNNVKHTPALWLRHWRGAWSTTGRGGRIKKTHSLSA